MSQIKVVCRNEECPDSLGRSPDPPQLQLIGETQSAWTFKCRCCEREGRISGRVVTKNVAGGTFGSGRRDDGTGQSAGEGVPRFVRGTDFR